MHRAGGQVHRRPAGGAPRPGQRRREKNRRRRPAAVLAVLIIGLGALVGAGFLAGGTRAAPASSAGGDGAAPVSSRAAGLSAAAPPAVVEGSSSEPIAHEYDPNDPYHEGEMPLLLNRDHYLPEGYDPQLAPVGYANGREQYLEARAAAAFLDMQAAAGAEGITLSPFSAHRSSQRQRANYDSALQSYLDQGYSRQQAEEMTRQYYAVPGTSEHEAGLAVDINGIEESFENTPAFAWLQANAQGYGYILRYAKDTTHLTGIAYEPWHYRYVGTNHAAEINRLGVTLEEYVAG